jgi:hypothetical protein
MSRRAVVMSHRCDFPSYKIGTKPKDETRKASAMEAVKRLRTVEAWVEWLRIELDRAAVTDLIAMLVAQMVTNRFGSCWVAAAFGAGIGHRLIAERIRPLLAALDEIQRRLQYAQIEAGVYR